MTTAMHSDIEQALAEALRTWWESPSVDAVEPVIDIDYRESAAAILATPPMQAFARWAERGRDVMLAGPFGVWQGECGHVWRVEDDGEDCPRCAIASKVEAFDKWRSDGMVVVVYVSQEARDTEVRQAAIGAAVERLGNDWWMEHVNGCYSVTVMRAGVPMSFPAATLIAAIAAALGDTQVPRPTASDTDGREGITNSLGEDDE